MSRRLAITGLLFGLLVGPIAYAVYTEVRENRLQSLLDEIDRAERETPYAGTRTMTVHGPKERHTTVLKLYVADEERRHVEFIETRVDGTPEKHDSKKTNRNLLRAPFFGGMPAFFRPGKGEKRHKFVDLALVTKNYDVAVTGRTTVAGRPADVVEIRARVAGRSSYRIAADATSRFPLAFAVLDAGGHPVFETEFESIEYNPVFAKDLFDEPKKPDAFGNWLKITQEDVALDDLSARVGFRAFVPQRPPKGFKLLSAELCHVKIDPPRDLMLLLPKLDSKVLHLSYTDGMAVYWVIEFPAADELWKQLKNLIPGLKEAGVSVEEKTGTVVARKITHPSGVALQLELHGTVIIAAGNISAEEIELSVETLVQR